MNDKTKASVLKQFGENMRAARLKSGYTQATLADALGICIAYVSLLERGGRNPPFTTVIAIAKVLGVTTGKLADVEA